MQAVATRLKDVGDQLYVDIAELPHIVAAFLTVTIDPPKIHVWTLLDERDPSNERRLTQSELRLLESFGPIDFDFTRIHLQGRDPRQFIPEGAYPVKCTDPLVLQHFTDTVRSGAHARS